MTQKSSEKGKHHYFKMSSTRKPGFFWGGSITKYIVREILSRYYRDVDGAMENLVRNGIVYVPSLWIICYDKNKEDLPDDNSPNSF